MPRVLLLCFIHGFKGDDDSFKNFPDDLKRTVASQVPGDRVEAVVYPKYATKGELTEASINFLEWLKERVMELRKAHLEKPWPPTDRDVGVVLVAHSMGGFVASDALFHALNERAANEDAQSKPLFPLIQGILAFDTPYNGLARSMFVYGAFSNYSKVSSVFNVMTALSAAPASLSMALKRGASSIPGGSSRVSNPAAWKAWQLVAIRTGTVGAIAAGGVAAYVHRQKIFDGVQNVRNLKRQDLVEGYQQGVDRLGQGLAYINRGNVGRSLAWLSDHFTFVGVLMKQQELNKRLERLANLGGVGVHDFYASMGENGYWSGGYFVPERTFCAVPAEDQPAGSLFSRHVVRNADDEIQAHMSMFKPDKNENYQLMVQKAGALAVTWFRDSSEITDDPRITEPEPAGSPENAIRATDSGIEVDGQEAGTEKSEEGDKSTTTTTKASEGEGDDLLPDESPLDIAAASSLAPLPDDDDLDGGGVTGQEGESVPDVKDKQTYLRYLMGVAQQAGTGLQSAGTGVKGYIIPTKLPTMPKPSMPTMPTMSMPSVSVPSVSMPSVGFFSRKGKSAASAASEDGGAGTTAATGSEEMEAAVNDKGETTEAAVMAEDAPVGATEVLTQNVRAEAGDEKKDVIKEPLSGGPRT